MAYLKALGIFRLVAEQKDTDARAWWHNDTFTLSTTLDRDGLVEFLLEGVPSDAHRVSVERGQWLLPKGQLEGYECHLRVGSAEIPTVERVVSIGKRSCLQERE